MSSRPTASNVTIWLCGGAPGSVDRSAFSFQVPNSRALGDAAARDGAVCVAGRPERAACAATGDVASDATSKTAPNARALFDSTAAVYQIPRGRPAGKYRVLSSTYG